MSNQVLMPCTITYTFTCCECGKEENQAVFHSAGEVMTSPKMPENWTLNPIHGGYFGCQLLCPKHSVQVTEGSSSSSSSKMDDPLPFDDKLICDEEEWLLKPLLSYPVGMTGIARQPLTDEQLKALEQLKYPVVQYDLDLGKFRMFRREGLKFEWPLEESTVKTPSNPEPEDRTHRPNVICWCDKKAMDLGVKPEIRTGFVVDANGLEYRHVLYVNVLTGELEYQIRDEEDRPIIEAGEVKTELVNVGTPLRIIWSEER